MTSARGAPGRRLTVTGLLCATLLILALAVLRPPTAGAATPTCTTNYLPVSLAPGQAVDQRVAAHLCVPTGKTPQTVQLLIHGCLYNSLYWNFPDPTGGTDRYSYVSAAVNAGYATLAFDMVGAGQSSHPLSTLLTVPAGVWVIHQIVQALRHGGLSGPAGPVTFAHVIEVSHSFGTFFSWLEVSEYNDVDAAIFTGATHHLAVGLPLLGAFLSLYPAMLDHQFFGRYDPGYLTTDPGARDRIFYRPASADPAVVTYDEQHKDLMAATEFVDFPIVLATPLNIRAPVLVVMGGSDPMFCSPIATNCSNAASMAAQEARFYGPKVPSVDGYVLAGAGHSINLMPNAGAWFAFAQDWATSKVPPA